MKEKLEIKVSVILPVYNVDLYIKEALDSLNSQTLQQIELIFVDDGSTDNSVNMIKEYMKKNPKITLLSQENAGAGVARNTGLSVARGKYVLFLDPDDFFEAELLSCLYERAEETQSEVTVCHAKGFNHGDQSVYEIHRFYNQNHVPEKDVFTYHDLGDKVFDTFGMVPWNKLFLRSFLVHHHILFQDLYRCNDAYFVMTAIIKAPRISVVKESLVYYRTNMQSKARQQINCFPTSHYQAHLAIYQMLQEEKVSEHLRELYLVEVMKYVFYSYRLVGTYEAQKTLYEQIHQHMEEDFHILEADKGLFVGSQYEEYVAMIGQDYESYLYHKRKEEQAQSNRQLLRSMEGTSVCLFGGSWDCEKVLGLFREYGATLPVAICDNSPTLQGTRVEGIPVYSFEEMASYYPDMNLIITIQHYYSEIEEQAKKKIPRERIFRLFVT